MTTRTLALQTTAIAVASSIITSIAVLTVAPSVIDKTQSSTKTGSTLRMPSVMRTIEQESAVVETVGRVEDAVASVVITKDLPVIERYFERTPLNDPFEHFFSDPFFSPFDLQIPHYRERGTERREVGGGTAFFISEDGLLLTNKHVVNDEEAEYTVILNDGRKLPAEVVTQHPGTDIAILKVDGEDFPYLKLSDEEPRLGQTVIAIGNALAEFRNTVSVGVISGLSRSITAGSALGGMTEQLDHIIQTDAAINHGNSGGPLLNLQGEVIGMNTAIAGGAQNIGFAIPASDLQNALKSYEEHGKIIQAYLGVRYIPITEELKERNNLSYDYGVLISRGETASDLAVIPGSPADKAGLQENDIILEADGGKLTPDTSLASIVRRKAPGDTLSLTIVSKGQKKEVTVTLEEMK
jgi:serine protease Do